MMNKKDERDFRLIYGKIFVNTELGVIDLSSYIPKEGALFIAIEADDSGLTSIHPGPVFDSKESADISNCPVPEEGKYALAYLLLYPESPIKNINLKDLFIPMDLPVEPFDTMAAHKRDMQPGFIVEDSESE